MYQGNSFFYITQVKKDIKVEIFGSGSFQLTHYHFFWIYKDFS
jgi:hypothetical protein